MAPTTRIVTVVLDMSKAFNTLIRKLLLTKIPGTIIKFIANCTNECKAHTPYRIHTSSPRQCKTGLQQGDVLSPKQFNIYTADIPLPRAPAQVMVYAYVITITSTHTSTSAVKKYIQPCIHKEYTWTKQNNLTLNLDKTTCTVFTPGPAEYKGNLDIRINNISQRMTMQPNVLGLTLYPNLTYSTHIHNISAHKPLQKHSLQHDGVNKRIHSWLPIR